MQWVGRQRVKGPLKTVFSLSPWFVRHEPWHLPALPWFVSHEPELRNHVSISRYLALVRVSRTRIKELRQCQSLDISSLGTANWVVSSDTAVGPPCNTFLIFSM